MKTRLMDLAILVAVCPGIVGLAVAGLVIDAVLRRLPHPAPSPVPRVLFDDMDADMYRRFESWRKVAA
jgi:hypothetical protein